LAKPFGALQARLVAADAAAPVSSFVSTPDGPAVVAVAPVARARRAGVSTATQPLALSRFVRLLNSHVLAGNTARNLVQ
jgi:hypothetical protein